jgi:hypothetical protein
MVGEPKYPFAEQGRRLRLLRQAERIPSGLALAHLLNWPQSSVSQFETGARRVPMNKALQLRAKIPGFDPLWLWEGDMRGLSYDLRKRVEAEEAKEATRLLSRREG